MGTETWIISLPLFDSILYLKFIHPPNFREEPKIEGGRFETASLCQAAAGGRFDLGIPA